MFYVSLPCVFLEVPAGLGQRVHSTPLLLLYLSSHLTSFGGSSPEQVETGPRACRRMESSSSGSASHSLPFPNHTSSL